MRRTIAIIMSLSALLIAGLVTAPAASADVYGWSWKKPVDVYVDATAVNAPVADSVAGWTGFRSGLRMNITTDPTEAEIVVRAAIIGSGVCVGSCPAGQAQLPSGRGDGTPDGKCRITVQPWHADGNNYPLELHIMLHEMGHCLGLAHPDKEGRQTIMNRQIGGKYGVMDSPGKWDERDIKGLYGRR